MIQIEDSDQLKAFLKRVGLATYSREIDCYVETFYNIYDEDNKLVGKCIGEDRLQLLIEEPSIRFEKITRKEFEDEEPEDGE